MNDIICARNPCSWALAAAPGRCSWALAQPWRGPCAVFVWEIGLRVGCDLLGMGNAMPGGLSDDLAIPPGLYVVAYRRRVYGMLDLML